MPYLLSISVDFTLSKLIRTWACIAVFKKMKL